MFYNLIQFHAKIIPVKCRTLSKGTAGDYFLFDPVYSVILIEELCSFYGLLFSNYRTPNPG